MSSLLREAPAAAEPSAAVERLRRTMAATKISFTWLGVHKTLTWQQKTQAADGFEAEARFLSASKRLLDTQHPRFKAVTALRGRIVHYWKALTLPYPEPGLRLIRQSELPRFDERLQGFRQDLAELVDQLEEQYAELRGAARRRLGRLWRLDDYPSSLRDEFAVAWEYPSVEPAHYLKQLSPELYDQECRRVRARFDEAVQLAEQAFADELSQLVSHLAERLSGRADGKPKVFRDSALENFTEFFQRFRELNLHSSEELDRLVDQTQQALRGLAPRDLRADAPLRQRIAGQMAGVQASLDGMLVDRPRRTILRPTRREAD